MVSAAQVMGGAAPYLKSVVLELGGEDAIVFCEYVQLADVIPWAVRGCFQNGIVEAFNDCSCTGVFRRNL